MTTLANAVVGHGSTAAAKITASNNGMTLTSGTLTSGTLTSGATYGPLRCSDVIIEAQSLKATLDAINHRLAILVPDQSKLAKFAALRQAYEHYKLMEQLCNENETN